MERRYTNIADSLCLLSQHLSRRSAQQQRGSSDTPLLTMTNVSNELVWSLVRRNSCFLYKRNGQTKR